MKMIINGRDYDSISNRICDNINPYDGSVYGTLPDGCSDDFELAAITARAVQPEWEAAPLYDRISIIYKFVSLVRDHLEEIAELMAFEGGKAIYEARAETECAANVFTGFAEAARNMFGNTMPLNADPRTEGDLLMTIREAIGVFVAILPFNFPVELFAHKVAPAIVTGNTVIVKPASYTPESAYFLVRLLHEAGLPKGVVQLITGSGKEVGTWLANTQNVDAISFTGSTEVGKKLMRDSAATMRRVFLELGGNDPFVVFEDCDLDLAVEEAAGGRTWNAGQTCCANKRFIIENSIKDKFVTKLVDKIKTLKVGNPCEADTVVGPLVSIKEAVNVKTQIAKTVEEGAHIVYGGQRNGAFITPCVIDGVTAEMDVANNMEIFGPVFPIIGFGSFDEAVQVANQTCYGLASGVMTSDMKCAMKFAKAVKAGTCVINGNGNYRSMQQPFGGYKNTGIGREGTLDTLLEFTQQKTIVLKKVLV
ncbi:MAG: aldehyde dehydrogenase family protein [Eubacteriales bacterium]|nr:aldehyde dehydrogenase family protein [Eubacteriales bacterium]